MRANDPGQSWSDDQYMIRLTGRNAYSVYRHIKDDIWVLLPKPGALVWYKSLSAAQTALKENYNHELKLEVRV